MSEGLVSSGQGTEKHFPLTGMLGWALTISSSWFWICLCTSAIWKSTSPAETGQGGFEGEPRGYNGAGGGSRRGPQPEPGGLLGYQPLCPPLGSPCSPAQGQTQPWHSVQATGHRAEPPLQPRNPSLVLPLPFIFLFQSRAAAPPPALFLEEGLWPGSAEAPAWLEPDSHTGASLRKGASTKSPDSVPEEPWGQPSFVSSFQGSEWSFGSFPFQHGRLELPKRLSTSVEPFVNEIQCLTGAREGVGPSPSTAGARRASPSLSPTSLGP